jgi:hypothetical protein
LFISVDFNVNPYVSIYGYICERTRRIHVAGEVVIFNAEHKDMAREYKKLFSMGTIMNADITGDSTGDNQQLAGGSNWYLFCSAMGINRRQVSIPSVNPRVKHTKTVVNSLFVSDRYAVTIDPSCTVLIADLDNVADDGQGGIVKGDRADPLKRGDALDCFRYAMHNFVYARGMIPETELEKPI